MLIPSIDIMGGKVVQLVQGEKKMLEFDSAEEWIERFQNFPLVQLIDLDAALGRGANTSIIEAICTRLPVQVGGGIRDAKDARRVLAAGARRVIIGSALFDADRVDTDTARFLMETIGHERLVFAIDSRGGHVAVKGWQNITAITPEDAIRELEPYCAAFLYTHIETEGTLSGFPIERALELKKQTKRQLIVAGGIRSQEEIAALDNLGVDCVVGMAIYSNLLAV
jgi:phosphoribosylformimino-5-aminoimidazole carboxamide ribotide isomerase